MENDKCGFITLNEDIRVYEKYYTYLASFDPCCENCRSRIISQFPITANGTKTRPILLFLNALVNKLFMFCVFV